MKQQFESIGPPDSEFLNASLAWSRLGNEDEAWKEFEKVDSKWKSNPIYFAYRYKIFENAKNWDAAFEDALALSELMPEKPEMWVCLADMTRRKTGGSISEAKIMLLDAEKKFPDAFIVPYRLACYCSQLREFDEAGEWLRKAWSIDPKEVEKLEETEVDLVPLVDSLG
jgi:tetratricopeptide (TPR) repeat protein